MPYYDRTELVETTLHTVMENLTIGMALVFLVLIFFLGNFRSAFIAAINIPLALLRRVHPDARGRHAGQPDFARRHRLRHHHQLTVIVVENIHHYLAPVEGEGSYRRIQRATQEVAGPIFFSP